MNISRIYLALVAVGLCGVVSLTAVAEEGLTDELVKKAAASLIEDEIVDGLSIGYMDGDKHGVVHLGFADEDGNPADNRTLYEVGSVSKVFTGLMLADAVVRGEIDLNDVANIENAAGIKFPSHETRGITWLDLSTHRSGLPRLPTNMQLTAATMKDPYCKYDSKKAAAFLKDFELTRAPGESQAYSNFAVSVLGYLVGQKAGMPYEQTLKKRIAAPLKMVDCTVSLSKDQQERLAIPHNAFESTTPPWTFADLPGAGGIRASMRDMMRFAKAQLNPPDNDLGRAIELAWKKQTDADDSGAAMGLGWMIGADGSTRWHNGQVGGSHSAVFINRKERRAVIVLCNTAVMEIDQLAMDLMRPGGPDLEKPGDANEKAEDVAVDAKHRARLVGKYKLTPNFIFDVKDRGGRLMVGITNQPTQEVFPDSPTRWSYKGVKATLEFKLPKKGSARSLILHQNGVKQMARRMK